MRLRHVITIDGRTFRDFDNASCDVMIVACHDRKTQPSATHKIKGGWAYRLDLSKVDGVDVVHVRGTHAVYGKRELYVPIGSFKELIPWTTQDDIDEREEAQARRDAEDLAKDHAEHISAGGTMNLASFTAERARTAAAKASKPSAKA